MKTSTTLFGECLGGDDVVPIVICKKTKTYLMSKNAGSDRQCWTEGRSSTAVAEDFRPTATATVAEV